MSDNKQSKPEYAIKVLTALLHKEEKGLSHWYSRLTSDDPLIVRMANGNIPSNEYRVKELKEVLELISPKKIDKVEKPE